MGKKTFPKLFKLYDFSIQILYVLTNYLQQYESEVLFTDLEVKINDPVLYLNL